jgi:A/G-specific adenine glycosylase
MLQQTQVKTVMPFWERWMRELPTMEAVARASSEKIHKLWEGLGYYHRARNMHAAARQIVAECEKRRETFLKPHPLAPTLSPNGGEGDVTRKLKRESHPNCPMDAQQRVSTTTQAAVRWTRGSASLPHSTPKTEALHTVSYEFPEKFEEVLALPGIGRYTAGAICSIAFNQPTPILDGNVMRVLTRLFGIDRDPREKGTNELLWRLAEELVVHAKAQSSQRKKNSRTRTKDEEDCSHLNQSLMELGALICTPRNPQCLICPVKKLCVAFKENRTEELPNTGKRAAATARRFVAFILEHRGKFLVRQRPEKVVNAHLWEFPNIETHTRVDGHAAGAAELFKAQFGFAAPELEPLPVVKHSITRYRITLEAFHVPLKAKPKGPAGTWLARAQLDSLALASAHRKIWSRLQKN